MTRALRRRHRIAVMVLAIALPTGIAVALAARPVLPPVTRVDAANTSTTDDRPLQIAWQAERADDSLRVVVRMGWTEDRHARRRGAEHTLDGRSTVEDEASAASPENGPVLDLDVAAHAAEPELLAFWVPGTVTAATQLLGDDAVLLGSATFGSPQRFALPDASRTVAGSLLLYSLAQSSIAAHVALPAAERLPGRDEGVR